MTTLTIHVGRIFSIGNLWGIKLLDGTGAVVLGVGGDGMTLAEAEKALDWIEARQINLTNKERCVENSHTH